MENFRKNLEILAKFLKQLRYIRNYKISILYSYALQVLLLHIQSAHQYKILELTKAQIQWNYFKSIKPKKFGQNLGLRPMGWTPLTVNNGLINISSNFHFNYYFKST